MNIITRCALVIVSTVVALPVVAAIGQKANAATLPKECGYWGSPATKDVSIAVKLRSGPGTNYTVLGVLYKGADFTEYCITKDYKWSWGKVTSGPNKGRNGWVSYAYLNPVYK
ncbi:SH3 domain-containing protein [Streptomyces niveiscabiei]|uniref:SH3 domain-containing protein n=1 Tax=Streptomyces niveiscabiei TaxID=164115 RepID=A0ABW9I4E7_9ACTN